MLCAFEMVVFVLSCVRFNAVTGCVTCFLFTASASARTCSLPRPPTSSSSGLPGAAGCCSCMVVRPASLAEGAARRAAAAGCAELLQHVHLVDHGHVLCFLWHVCIWRCTRLALGPSRLLWASELEPERHTMILLLLFFKNVRRSGGRCGAVLPS